MQVNASGSLCAVALWIRRKEEILNAKSASDTRLWGTGVLGKNDCVDGRYARRVSLRGKCSFSLGGES